ncbi:MAG: monoterpene epsilon-lactone hydrolase [Gammaproteobacteria bacterium]|jgi:monoterpene epsilon-lactone hydrolase
MILEHLENLKNGMDLSQWDTPREPEFRSAPASEIHKGVVEYYTQMIADTRKGKFSLKKMRKMTLDSRKRLDERGSSAKINSRIVEAIDPAVPGEWVIAPGADPDKRMLYIHGGAFRMGSPRSHRAITSKMSEILGGAVFAVEYRLTPENSRLACLTDVRNAYVWLISNGPEGKLPANQLYVAGDSAGANLTLGLLPWIRLWGYRKPTAAVAISPSTDSTLQSPSIQANLKTDAMLKGLFGIVNKVPKPVFKLIGVVMNRTISLDPRLSPINYSLHDLPPTLVHASTAECLEDDARRWVNKAKAAGSPARIQLWANMIHVWHAFISLDMPESIDAFNEIEKFFKEVA